MTPAPEEQAVPKPCPTYLLLRCPTCGLAPDDNTCPDPCHRADAPVGAAPQAEPYDWTCIRPAAPGAVETPLVDAMIAWIEQGEFPDEDAWEIAQNDAPHLRAELSALRASARTAPTEDEIANVLLSTSLICSMQREPIQPVAARFFARSLIAHFFAGALPAPPSAERILTQATDEQIKACADEIAYEASFVNKQLRHKGAEAILRKHFPARSGAAVVLLPKHEPHCIDDLLSDREWVNGYHAALNRLRDANPDVTFIDRPAPSTASETERA